MRERHLPDEQVTTKIQPFLIIIEIRNTDGITLNMQLQKGTLNPSGEVEVGFSWRPDETGSYEARAFVVTSLKNPELLSALASKSINVI